MEEWRVAYLNAMKDATALGTYSDVVSSSIETCITSGCISVTVGRGFRFAYRNVLKADPPTHHTNLIRMWCGLICVLYGCQLGCYLLHGLEQRLSIILECHDQLQLGATRFHGWGKQ